MTALLDLHPDAGHPVLAGVVEVHGLLDRMHATSPTGISEHAHAVREVDRAIRRLTALKLKLLAAAEHAGTAQDAGFTGTGAWVARHTAVPRATAAREVALATGLESGHDATAAALDQGLVSPAHAAVILHATRQLPAPVSTEQRELVEQALVEQACRFDPDQLRRVARRALAAVEPDPQVVDAHENELLRSEEEAARDKCAFTLHDNGDGTHTGHFTLPTLPAAILTKILDAMTAPRRLRHTVVADGSPGGDSDWRHRRGLAFAELCEHLPTDHLHPRSTATVVVTIDHTVLHDALKAAHLDTGAQLSAGEARRLACTAGLLPAVLGTDSVALDLGREARLFDRHQALALGLRHDTCAADGCHRPYAWCELHHRKPWSHGGHTNLADAIPLCHTHHQAIHDQTYHHRRMPDGSIRFSRRT